MARDRVNQGFGGSKIAVTGTTAGTYTGSWIPFGPFLGSRFCLHAVFSSASTAGSGDRIKVQGVLDGSPTSTGVSTAGAATLVARLSSQAATPIMSTSALVFNWIRVLSTDLPNGRPVTVHIAALGA